MMIYNTNSIYSVVRTKNIIMKMIIITIIIIIVIIITIIIIYT